MGEMRRIERAREARRVATLRCIGRTGELSRLEAALAAAADGRGTSVVLAGDPGIGKTHIAEEIAARATTLGFRVYWGRCHSDAGAPSLWPWLQVLRTHAERSEPDALRDELGIHAPVLAAVVPALRERLPVLSAPATLQGEESRFRLLEAIASMIRRSAATAPWLVLLDDLQWADLPTLQLFRFATRELRDAPVLLLGTLRDTELDPNGDALRLLRETGAARIDLAGLSEAQVAQLLASQIGDASGAAWAGAVRAATGGNPFFVDRVARLLPRGEGGSDASTLRIPEEVRDVIRGQIARLTPEDARVVSRAAVIGREFELSLLARVCAVEPLEALRRLGAALETRLVRAGSDARHYGFVHPLIQEVVYSALSPAERDACHLLVGEAIETTPGGERDADRFARLAHHFLSAAHLGVGERAIDYADRAAASATTLSAYEEAERLLQAALDLCTEDLRRVDLQLRLGEARRGASNHGGARAAFGDAAKGARRLGDPVRLAHAALGFAGFWASLGFVDGNVTSTLEEAIESLGENAPALRARLLARLALELTLGGSADVSLRTKTANDALALARASGDDAAIAYALYSQQLELGPLRTRTTWTEVAERATHAQEIDLALAALAWQTGDALQEGDMAGFDASASAHAALGGAVLHRTSRINQIVWHGIRAVHDGRFADAEGPLAEIPRHYEPPQNAAYAAPGVLAIRWHQGRLGEMAPLVRMLADGMPSSASGHVWLAWIRAELGEIDEARERIDRVAANDFELLARSPFWTLDAALLGQAMAATGDAHRAAPIVDRLLPIAHQRAVHGTGISDFGPIARTLGLLAEARGDLDEAVSRLEQSVAADTRIGAKPHRVYGEIDLARTLRTRGAPGDDARSAELLGRARTVAKSLGMQGALARLDAQRPAHAPGRVRTVEAELVRGESGPWSLRVQDRVHPLGDVKGMVHLCEILRTPGHAIAASDLAGDAPALRSDLHTLRDALLDAEELGDAERVEHLRDALESRVSSREDATERARVNVTRALKLAVRRIAEAEPLLGRDLEANLKTGTFCSYEPDPHHPVRWLV